ncbi:DUF7822 domain-containing protein [Streptomyces thermolilacinus]|uniref:DUF7822 domain-containing protein n=1 Tax=Streptomyces thermolilacinus SPC6 TaxID=1306406 RepID=A0A1D3DW01_9ACTN|nr:hypothetical protein [Streptomyces thermolilacinus]OEJ96493.1 hypothetical protein J116_020580 [Streptomyces thermolilacinus SPC6]
MANRSYLYSADSMPDEAEIPRRIRCVSEHNWDIPLAHKLLAGRGTTVVPSMIWNPRIGIAADYAAGAALLRDLLHAVGKGLDGDPGFAECVARTTAHLEKQQARYFVLETGEIVSMTDDDPEASVRRLASEDIPDAVAEAQAAIAGRNDDWLASVRADWQRHFASFYSEALYFSFPC